MAYAGGDYPISTDPDGVDIFERIPADYDFMDVVRHHTPEQIEQIKRAVTVGRKKRKRRKGAGTAVKITSHTRSPRGSNSGKKRVRVDGYKRGAAPKKGRRKKR